MFWWGVLTGFITGGILAAGFVIWLFWGALMDLFFGDEQRK